LELVGLEPAEFARRWPGELSGGQQQRVGVARALGADPPVLLMDEPFGAIDPITRHRLQEEFLDLQKRVRKTVVFVTHDLDEAALLGDRIALLRQGGHLEQYATPGELLGAPATEFVAEFVGTDRSLRRLAVTALKAGDAVTLSHAESTPADAPQLRVGDSLRDALVAILDAPAGTAVIDDAGVPCGTIDAAGLHAAARRSLSDER
jgi:osmoprotectant transport system ATP-binding protein